MKEIKTAKTAGADENTPSIAEYFSWINNTNEGSTQKQTLVNFEYFGWLKDTYNMQLDIYAWDAGNLDGAGGTYERLDGEKLSKQYPNGYAPIGEAAGKLNMKLGVWCGPDGFGDTQQSVQERKELMVSLCRDYRFGLFKMDSVCGNIRRNKLDVFSQMMTECRKYSPQLILLNHRLRLGKAEKYATTSLLGGAETYVDVHIANENTAFHHRAFTFKREGVPGLKRLTEDHGVCLSSCLDYFEDDMIFQAFGRCLILAPEIYANPWLLRDDEQAHMARIFNLHRTYRDILVNGMKLNKKDFGANAVSRGDGKTRLITAGNCSWNTTKIRVKLDGTIGLEKCEKVFVASHHPFERVYGEYSYGDTVEIAVMPFRAILLHVCDSAHKPFMLNGCEYEVLHEKNDIPDKVKLVKVCSSVTDCDGKEYYSGGSFDNTNRAPLFMGQAKECEMSENLREMLETAYYAIDPDSLEARSLKRSGKTAVSQIQAARDEFFNQKTYVLRGCESRYAFDGKEDTFFDAMTKICFGGMRVKGGCLRIDFGEVLDADSVIIEYFDPDKPDNETITPQHVARKGEYAESLGKWTFSSPVTLKTLRREALEAVIFKVHTIGSFEGRRRQAIYEVNERLRYFQIPEPMDRIFKISAVKDGKELTLNNARVTNVMPPVSRQSPVRQSTLTLKVAKELWKDGCYLSIAIDGKHGNEGVTVVAECKGKLSGCPDRAPSYSSNTFECPVRAVDSNYTYFLPVSKDMCDDEIRLHVIYLNKRLCKAPASVWLCDGNQEKKGVILSI